MEDVLGKKCVKSVKKKSGKRRRIGEPSDQSSARDRAGQPAGSGKSGNDLSYR